MLTMVAWLLLLLCPAGYWPSDFYKTNPAFGSTEDLKHLLKSYQDKGELTAVA